MSNSQGRTIGTFFNLKDLIVIITPLIAVASAFFAYDTRISVLETKNETTKQEIYELNEITKSNIKRLYSIELENSSQNSQIEAMKDDLKQQQRIIENVERIINSR